jgi:hypothetical protein
MTQKGQRLKSPSVIPLPTRTYLLCAPSRYSLLGTESLVVVVVATESTAANTFRSLSGQHR